MYRHCNTEESALRQKQLEQCLLEQMSSVPYSQITVSDICDRAGLSRKSFYRYFGSKEGCLTALIDHTIIDGASFYLSDQWQQSHRSVCERFFLYWHEHAALLDALTRNEQRMLFCQRLMNHAFQEEHEIRALLGKSQNASYGRLTFMISGILGMLLSWHHQGFSLAAEEMADILLDATRDF